MDTPQNKNTAATNKAVKTEVVSKEFINDYTRYFKNQKVESNCNRIKFINAGNIPVTINTLTLNPGDIHEPLGGYPGEIDKSKYDLVFNNSDVPVGTIANPSVFVIRKYYDINC